MTLQRVLKRLSPKLGELQVARKMAAYFTLRLLRQHPAAVIAVCVLAIVSVAAQLLFLGLLPVLIGRLFEQAESVTTASLMPGIDTLSPEVLIGVAVALLVATALCDYVQQRLAAKSNIDHFRTIMYDALRKVTDAELGAKRVGILGTRGTIQVFTKGSRYGALVGYRALRVIRPLLSIPPLLGFCIWNSPLLTAGLFCVVLITLPVHALVTYHGVSAMRRLLVAAGRHMTTKKDLVVTLLQFPHWDRLHVDRLQRETIDDGSSDYLNAYFERRLLAARSNLVTLIGSAAALGAIFVLLFTDHFEVDISVPELVVFVLALRMLIVSIGNVLTQVTMVMSYVPLCHATSELLQGRYLGNEVTQDAGLSDSLTLDNTNFPQFLLFSALSKPSPEVRHIVAAVAGDDIWKEAGIVRGQYSPLYKNLREDLLIDTVEADNTQMRHPMPDSVRQMIEDALEIERSVGWSEELWEGLHASVKFHCTLDAALARCPKAVIFVGPVQAQASYVVWREVVDWLEQRGVTAVQVMEAHTKRVFVPEGTKCVFHGTKSQIVGFVGANAAVPVAVKEHYEAFKLAAPANEVDDDDEAESDIDPNET